MSANSGPEKWEEKKEVWEAEIGRAILSFCNIERSVADFLEYLPTEPIVNSAPQGFGQKVDLLLEILTYKDIDNGLKTELETALKLAKKLAETRNLIVHNPLRIQPIFTDDHHWVEDREIIEKRNRKGAIGFRSLTEFADEADNLKKELFRLQIVILKGPKNVLGLGALSFARWKDGQPIDRYREDI